MALIVILVNKSHLAPISDYTYEIQVGDGTIDGTKTLETGVVKGHERADGYPELLRALVDELDRAR